MAQNGPPYQTPDWKAAVATKRKELYESIPKTHLLPADLAERASAYQLLPEDPAVLACGILTDLDIEITSIEDASELRDKLARKQYTAVQVAEAFCKRASIAQQCTNCLTEIFYDRALTRAKELDDHLEKTGKVVGSLHGLPVSVKDCYGVAGKPITAGLVSWIPNVVKDDSSVTKGLLAAGAVLYVKTNVSQAHLMVESINNVFGTTRNPYNLALSVGGSSGGEAGLVAAKGAVLASATDGGGSIRFPALFCGLWGLKCSKGRMPMMGLMSPSDGSESTFAGLGPMAKTTASLELWLKAQLDNEPWEFDHTCIPMAWKTQEAKRTAKPLTFGVIWDDGVIRPTPPITRALNTVVQALKKAGHKVVDLPESTIKSIHTRGTSCVMKANVQSGGYAVMKHIEASGEPVVPRTATGSPASELTSQEVFANHIVRGGIAGEYNALWEEYGMDAILAPAVAHPAPPHGKYISNAYAGIYNLLDYVTGSIPVGKVDLEKDVASKEWYDAPAYERIEPIRFPYDWGDKEMKELYTSPEVFANAPTGVQIACKRLREEKCLSILKEIEALLTTN